MRRIIHFRSREASHQTGIGSLKKIRNQGSEYESIRPATLSDDARDIAWKQSARSETLSVKSREEYASIDIELIGIADMSWDFSLEYGDDKRTFYGSLQRSCQETAESLRYPYKTEISPSLNIASLSEGLQKKKIQKKLILIIVSSLTTEDYSKLRPLAQMNDILVIHLLHPYEKYPKRYKNILVESSDIRAEYEEKLQEREEDIKILLLESGISFLSALSTDDPVKLLNHFFKHRYAHPITHRSRFSS